MGTKVWIAFFSQTGSEIADISHKLGKWPDVIITNERPDHLRTIDPRVEKQGYFTWSNKPSEEDYIELFEVYPEAIVTLHGWLRIVPEYVCERSEIYNGHPGLITKYPELKGKDPQIRAFEGKFPTIGCVIHKVVAGVDEGDILFEDEIPANNLEVDDIFRILKDRSYRLWCIFLKDKLWSKE